MKKMIKRTALGLALGGLAFGSASADEVFVGHLVDFTGPTAFVGKLYGPGVADAIQYINANGGIGGTTINTEPVDYSYKVPQAIATYKRWTTQDMVAMQGWGTGDTEALISFVARDEIPVWSASYSGHLTDPTGANPKTKKPAPYNFFYGPSYSDGCRALVQWAAQDWSRKGNTTPPKFVHMGDNHPYPNAPKEACRSYAEELGFEIIPPVVVSLKPGDFKAQCLTIKEAGVNYAYIGNLGGSVVSIMKSCDTVGTDVQFMGNTWAGDRLTMKAAGEAANGYAFVASTAFWEDDAPGMELVRKIAAHNGDITDEKKTHHYIRGICTAYYMKEAMEWAKANGGITGANIKQGMYAKQDWVPAGLEGVCIPSTWTPEDHRGTMEVNVYRGDVAGDTVTMSKVASTTLPRRQDWLGW
ncbi:MAG: ABC transporter substrate-binding protein [Magnetovibrionaceae bacterium]